MIRVGAVGDIHLGVESRGTLNWADVDQRADVMLVAGDLTREGTSAEASVVAEEFAACPVPVVCVLGNHDYHRGEPSAMTAALREAGAVVLEGSNHVVEVAGYRLGIAGVKGFGGGFAGRCGTEFGEPEMKQFIAATAAAARRLRAALDDLRVDYRVALLHYAPVPDTLRGEPLEIYPFLGSYLLGEAIDDAGADLVVHGHAHSGSEIGRTTAGVPVRNVAQPVIRAPYTVYRCDAPATAGRHAPCPAP